VGRSGPPVWTRYTLQTTEPETLRSIMEYAKAIAGAVTALVVFVVSHYGLELPPEVTVAVETLLTALAVYLVPNKEA
jgi:hypothetical protein